MFVPKAADELREGWQLHVARRRLIHERAARTAQRTHYVVGSLAVVLASFAGSSLVTSWNADDVNPTLGLVGGVSGAIAAMLTAFQTFLDLGGRAERHRQAANTYKALLRQFERMAEARQSEPDCEEDTDKLICTWLTEIQEALVDADDRAPVVPARLAQNVEELTPYRATTLAELTTAPPHPNTGSPPTTIETSGTGSGND
jgi:hypothetical protein